MSSIYIQEPPTNGKVLLKTNFGDIDIELWSKETPKACRNFVQLCLEGYYDNTIFHRVVKGFIAQGGDPDGTGVGGESIYGHPFKDEIHSRLRFTRRGLIAMANNEPNSNRSQFFFTLGPAPELNEKNTIFGQVFGDTLYNMLKLDDVMVDKDDKPIYEQKVLRAEILKNPFPDIQPRKLQHKSHNKFKEHAEQKVEKIRPVRNYKLLSFGEEAEADELQNTEEVKKYAGKGKSSHDLLNDPNLSSKPAVDLDDLSTDDDQKRRRDSLEEAESKLETKKWEKSRDYKKSASEEDKADSSSCEKKRKKRDSLEKVKSKLKINKPEKSHDHKKSGSEEDKLDDLDEKKMKKIGKSRKKKKSHKYYKSGSEEDESDDSGNERKKQIKELQKQVKKIKKEIKKQRGKRDKIRNKVSEKKVTEAGPADNEYSRFKNNIELCKNKKSIYPETGAARELKTLSAMEKFQEHIRMVKHSKKNKDGKNSEYEGGEENSDTDEWMTQQFVGTDYSVTTGAEDLFKVSGAEDLFKVYDPRNEANNLIKKNRDE